MSKKWMKGLSLVLAVVMVMGMLPITAYAAVDSTGRPKDVNNSLVLSIYTGSGFPGEPAVYGTSDYRNFNSRFEIRTGAIFANSAKDELDWTKIDKDIVQGNASGSTSVWGVYDANGTKNYFLNDASIIQPANEAKMIRAIKTDMKNKTDSEVLAQYEIVWYVIKLQHSSGWFGRTEWHIDGVIKEKEKISINYYGNGNTSGAAPLGTATHISGEPYTIRDRNTLARKINGVEVAFLGWSAKADGTGAEAGFYQPGDVINPTQSISLYAMWDTTTQYTATVNTYLDGVLTSDTDIHGRSAALYLSTDNEYFYALTEDRTGVYTTKITGNGKFLLYNRNADGTYSQVGGNQLTIYNQNGSMDVHHYSVSYDANGGTFEPDPGKQVFYYGSAVTAINAAPKKDGYRFLGWKTADGTLVQPGDEVTASITAPITLTAQWEKTVDVTINVTINHAGGDGYDQMDTRDDVFLTLVSRADDSSAYLETGDTLVLSQESHEGFVLSQADHVTRYTASGPAFMDLPGSATGYTVVTSKSGYDTSVAVSRNTDGDWFINVEMTYNPTNFDLTFTVQVHEDVPEQYLPDAAIVKVSFWSSDREQWEIITQQEGGKPGVRVDFDPATRSGVGSYPVWKYESDGSNPYGYRMVITSFVYPDDTIVPASQVLQENVQWSDNVYTATVDDVVGGQIYGALDGAYYSDATGQQEGTLNAVITMDIHDVTFDGRGGQVNGQPKQLVADQYKIPNFKNYTPVREGGYTFSGWYEDEACTIPAAVGKDLTADVTLYAKWIDPLTVCGNVIISGTYLQNGEIVSVHDIDRATEAVVVLQELRDGAAFDIDSKIIYFGSYGFDGSADFSFEGLPNDGTAYQIRVLVLNYGTAYDNESDSDVSYSATEYLAVPAGDNEAVVNAYMEFVPPSYDQILNVDATQIGEGFRPHSVLSEVMYRDTGDTHAFQRISQHDVAPYGVPVQLTDGIGSGIQSIWKWHTDGTLYDYQMNISVVDDVAYDSDTALFSIVYDAPAYWDGTADAPSGELKATLIPNQYLVSFDLNAGDDAVTGMDAYLDEETETYQTMHTWSFDTAIDAVPVRAGYTFLGWEADAEDVYDGSKIDAAVHQDVVLSAKWEKIPLNSVVTMADPAEGGTTTGDGQFLPGTSVTVTAAANEGYQFDGWYENEQKISDDAAYTFTVSGDHMLTAKFTEIPKPTYTINATANPADGGSVTGAGTYKEGTVITLKADVNEGYTFVGWYDENNELITLELEFTHTVTENRQFKARYNMISVYKNNYAYIFGYTDTVMGAEGRLIRAEAAVMIHRLAKQNNERGDFVFDRANPSFKDIAGQWFQCGVEYIHYRGGISSAEGTYVNPYAQITRGEVFKFVALGLGFTEDRTLSYDGYGQILADRGYIIGSSGNGNLDSGSFMNRAEFCTMFNRIIGRANAPLVDADGNQITAETYGFTDLKPGTWYYEDMLRATSAYDDNGFVDMSKRAIRNVVDDYS